MKLNIKESGTVQPKYGFYSKKAHKLYGCAIYTNLENQEIKVTYVTDDPVINYYSYKWDDKEFVGEVRKYICHFQHGLNSNLEEYFLHKINNNPKYKYEP